MPLSSVVGAQSIVKPGVCTSSTRPASPFDGQVIYETDTDRAMVWNGTGWVVLSTGRANSLGLDLIKTQTIGTAVSTVAVADAFSATYDAYKIIITGGAASAATNLKYQNTGSTTQYYSGGTTTTYSNNSVAGFSDNNQASMLVGTTFTGSLALDITVMNPFLAKETFVSIGAVVYSSGAGAGAGLHNVATSYTGFTIFPQSGTLTGGTIAVYGYAK
jgi:hypothetical protein